MRAIIVTILVLLFGASGPAFAADPVSQRKLELAVRFIEVSGFTDQMKAILDVMVPGQMQERLKDQPHVTAEQRVAAIDSVLEASPLFLQRLVAVAAPIYADAFEEAELEAIIAFYESPAGRAIVSKSPALAGPVNDAVMALTPDLQADIRARLCEKINCTP